MALLIAILLMTLSCSRPRTVAQVPAERLLGVPLDAAELTISCLDRTSPNMPDARAYFAIRFQDDDAALRWLDAQAFERIPASEGAFEAWPIGGGQTDLSSVELGARARCGWLPTGVSNVAWLFKKPRIGSIGGVVAWLQDGVLWGRGEGRVGARVSASDG